MFSVNIMLKSCYYHVKIMFYIMLRYCFLPRAKLGSKNITSGPPRVLKIWRGTGPGLPKHPRVEPRAGPGLDPTHPYMQP